MNLIQCCRCEFTEPDPAFQVNTDPDPIWMQGFDDQKVKKKNTAEICFSFFDQNYTLLIPIGLHKGHPSYRRSLPPSKEYIQYLKFINPFSIFVGHFCPSGSEYGSRDPAESGSNPDPDPDPQH
jgi:hypothetical protein